MKDHIRLLHSDIGDQTGPDAPPTDAHGERTVLHPAHDEIMTVLVSDMAQLLDGGSSFGKDDPSRAQADDMQWISASLANTGGSDRGLLLKTWVLGTLAMQVCNNLDLMIQLALPLGHPSPLHRT